MLERARAILFNRSAARGEETRASLKRKAGLSGLNRNLERRFPALCYGESQQAADRFMQEAARSNPKRRSRQTLRAAEPAARIEQSCNAAGAPEQGPRAEAPISGPNARETTHQELQDAREPNSCRNKQPSALLPKPCKRLRKASSPRGNSKAQRKKQKEKRRALKALQRILLKAKLLQKSGCRIWPPSSHCLPLHCQLKAYKKPILTIHHSSTAHLQPMPSLSKRPSAAYPPAIHHPSMLFRSSPIYRPSKIFTAQANFAPRCILAYGLLSFRRAMKLSNL